MKDAPGTEDERRHAGPWQAPAELEARVVEQIHEFDPIALLAVLRALRYGPDEVLFQSQGGALSQASLFRAIEFRKRPRMAVVTVSVGLLGPQTPLPTYFAQLLTDDEIDEEALTHFLRFFDHKLIGELIQATHPESDARVFHDWEGVKQGYVRLLGLRSVSTLHWLYQLVFPELDVEVKRTGLKRWMQLNATRLNYSPLGPGSVLGGWGRMPVPGFSARVYADEEQTEHGHPWAEEVRRRLHKILFPEIWHAAIDIDTTLVIRSEKVWARLRPGSYLGFDRMRGGPVKNREIHVWRGLVTETTVTEAERRARGTTRHPRPHAPAVAAGGPQEKTA